MKAAQKHVGGDRARVQHLQEMLGCRFDELPAADEVKGFVPHGGLPSRLRRAGLEVEHGVHDILPLCAAPLVASACCK